ncbi:6-carboxyhexanoate--CoA ligase [Noviherbaspirillum denitrificans]|uniref:6-carboxyhexanoate--CoA ligase n=2 Tax=Noviherbaspirillum denitrificans TaxID=1968433 RepID=A0A254TJC6_9BURK|nr:6-carboxyhexanoate--CoA ligase [Noviherbaspirillum denitrificans]
MHGLRGPALGQALLNPKKIALVGVSDDLSKTTARPLRFLRTAGYGGTIYTINPTRKVVQGEPAYPSLSALPEVPDHAFILTNSELAIDAVEECGKLGIPVATIMAAGFSESGHEGVKREQRLKAIAKDMGVRVLGPSSLGVINVREKLVLTANAAFAEADLPAGGIFCASQSGSMLGALTSRGRARNIGFAGLVSVGGESDLCIGEICEATLDDPNVTGYMLFLESMRHADALHRFALGAAARGKPVVAFKLGRSEVAAELAVSHTGALAGEDSVADTFFSDCGIARVETLDGLLEAMPLLARIPASASHHGGRKPTVGVVTTTGGGAAMAVDQLGIRGVNVIPPSKETLKRLAERGIEASGAAIVDLTLAGTKYEVMKATLEVMQSAPEFDMVLATVGSSARYQPDLAVAPVIDSAHAGKPLACFVVPEAPDALKRLTEAGVPSFRTPEACGDVIAAAFRRRAPVPQLPPPPAAKGERMLDEASAYKMLTPLGVPHAAYAVLAVDAPVPALPFPFPVVVKVLHEEIAHKTDVGGVILNVDSTASLAEAMARIKLNVEKNRPGTVVRQVLVQAMSKGLGEVLVGFRRDADVGPVVMLAAGGVLTEIYRDRALRLAPVTVEVAREMVKEVRALEALAGYRGRQEGDLEAVAQAVAAFSQLALLKDEVVLEAEMNPLIVRPKGDGALAVDALVRLG